MTVTIPGPCLLFLGDVPSRLDAKTASGILQWRPERCAAQYRLSPQAVDLGLPDMSPAEAAAAGARTMVVGIAPFGGKIDPTWVDPLASALRAGLDLAAGMHARLADHPVLAETARACGRRLYDVRQPTGPIPIAAGRKRTGRRLLTVGTDCAVGKKYAALSIHKAMAARGTAATFRATGQTGILISGEGIAIDAVVADFAAGAAEQLSPDNAPEHWDVIEGQGSLFHPAYAGVSLALLHGSQPDAIVVCHDPGRAHIDGYPDFPLPTLEACIEANLRAARLTNPAVRCAGIALDTSRTPLADRAGLIADAAARTGVPAFDPIATGASAVVDALLAGG
jgi:uncharacterized NAD-dependent epimerase/dehydratase family protein